MPTFPGHLTVAPSETGDPPPLQMADTTTSFDWQV
jgi:hypothetical protein